MICEATAKMRSIARDAEQAVEDPDKLYSEEQEMEEDRMKRGRGRGKGKGKGKAKGKGRGRGRGRVGRTGIAAEEKEWEEDPKMGRENEERMANEEAQVDESGLGESPILEKNVKPNQFPREEDSQRLSPTPKRVGKSVSRRRLVLRSVSKSSPTKAKPVKRNLDAEDLSKVARENGKPVHAKAPKKREDSGGSAVQRVRKSKRQPVQPVGDEKKCEPVGDDLKGDGEKQPKRAKRAPKQPSQIPEPKHPLANPSERPSMQTKRRRKADPEVLASAKDSFLSHLLVIVFVSSRAS